MTHVAVPTRLSGLGYYLIPHFENSLGVIDILINNLGSSSFFLPPSFWHENKQSQTYDTLLNIHEMTQTEQKQSEQVQRVLRLQRIGQGHCGSVWAGLSIGSLPLAIKREDGGPGRSLRNEFDVQRSVVEQTKAKTVHIQALIPQCLTYINPQDDEWPSILASLPENYEPCNAMISEKIRSVSAASRACLVEQYYPEAARQEILDDPKNKHCLIRIYLGRRRLMSGRPKKFLSLRNFPLHADQAEELGLPYKQYARAMGEALAMLHWRVKTDGADVEFVLGAPRWTALGDGNGDDDEAQNTLALSEHPLWMLDYDCSKPVEPNDAGIEAMARAFWRNDPYYPRPYQKAEEDRRLWEVFAEEYRKVGMEIVGEDGVMQKMVSKVIQRIENWK